jgi:prepilin-type N-terminal cleavage/methylation domain-containing protein
MSQTFRSKRAFTLIELLTVIAIIGVLIALLFPAIKSALIKAEATKAQHGVTDLATAFQHYYTEYGHWPVGDSTTSNLTYIVDTNFVALLQGLDNRASLTYYASANFPSAPNLIATSTLQGNPRGIHFLDIKQADLSPTLGFTDPWKQPYFCRFDVSYANTVGNPFLPASPGVNVNSGVLIWSAGPDGQFDAGGDVPPSAANKDNIKNW